jgi:3-isopropylmalate/(R)-2-methylmalate dehydratase small subunit
MGLNDTLTGTAYKFGDNISTDLIAPGRLFHLRSQPLELAKHVLEDARVDFAQTITPGKAFVVAGDNMWLGSSREHAPLIMKLEGINAVLAKGAARIFYRNCINVGLPIIICDTDTIEEGDDLEVDQAAGVVRDRTKGIELIYSPLPKIMIDILDAGGLVEYIKAHGDFQL